MRKIWFIGLNTFREAIRNKVLYSLFFFSLAVIAASLAFGSLSVNEEVRLTTDLSFAGMSLFTIIIAVFVGVNLVYKELERKTVYTLLPKPIMRYQFVLGKFTGLVMTLFVLILIMSTMVITVLMIQGASLHVAYLMMICLVFLEAVVVTGVALVFSSFSTPFLSGLFTMGIFVLGRNVPDIVNIAQKVEDASLRPLVTGIARVLPNLRYFYVSGTEIADEYISINGTFVDWTYVVTGAGYALLYTAVLLALASLLFSRRDFT